MSFAVFLKREFEQRRARNPRYSLRAFAGALHTDHATLSQIMRGRRTITEAALAQIGAALGLAAVQLQRARELDEADYAVLDAVREGIATTGDIASNRALTIDRVNVALHRLLRLRLIDMRGKVWLSNEEVSP